jgi:hypothetical protein
MPRSRGSSVGAAAWARIFSDLAGDLPVPAHSQVLVLSARFHNFGQAVPPSPIDRLEVDGILALENVVRREAEPRGARKEREFNLRNGTRSSQLPVCGESFDP